MYQRSFGLVLTATWLSMATDGLSSHLGNSHFLQWETVDSCVDNVCSKLGGLDCDDAEEIRPIYQACFGPAGEQCVNKVCEMFGSLDCDDEEEIVPIVIQCRGKEAAADCIAKSCEYMGGSIDCDDQEEVFPVVNACEQHSDLACIDRICKRSASDCDDTEEMVQVIRVCTTARPQPILHEELKIEAKPKK